MSSFAPSPSASIRLNLIRGLAAVQVLIYHVRYRFFFDYADVDGGDALTTLFYVATSFGHDAVMVFFVLSGYFISGSVLRDRALERWSWSNYAITRVSRFYVVLLPGLALTVFWDSLGLSYYPNHPIYTGVAQSWIHDFFDVDAQLTIVTLASNLVFLQSIYSTPLGSNDPLWSLSFEFWYYAIFPILCFGLSRAIRPAVRLVLLSTAAGLFILIGAEVSAYFPVWLLGTLVCLAPSSPRLARLGHFVTVPALAVFAFVVAATHIGSVREMWGNSIVVNDYLTGISFAMFLYVLLQNPHRVEVDGRYARLAGGLAAISFTLYVSHMPLLVFLRATLLPGAPWRPTLWTVICGIGLSLLALGYAAVLARFTESHTARIRGALLRGWRQTPRPWRSPATSVE